MNALRRTASRIASERGQSMFEYLGMILVVGTIVAVITGSGIAAQITRDVRDEVCNVLGDGCAEPDPEAEKARDTDDDGLSDVEERRRDTRPGRADTDYDELTDGEELRRRTSPLRRDTDRDGVSDGREIERETDPLEPERGAPVRPDASRAPPGTAR